LGRNCLLGQGIEGEIKGGIEVTEDEKEDVGNYWMTLRKEENILISRRKFHIAQCGEFTLKKS
jgi:hypothetical protein